MNIELTPHLDLTPIYPTPVTVNDLLETQQLTLQERKAFIAHCLQKSIIFGDITLLTYLLRHPLAKAHVDLSVVDDDGLGLVSQAIICFGEESDRDLEREETIRLLVAEGADLTAGDSAGWTPLHHAAVHAPPTLVSFLLSHGASPLVESHKGMTPWSVITAYEDLPGRQHVAFLLEEAMRGCGWGGSDRGRHKERRRMLSQARQDRYQKRLKEWRAIGDILQLEDGWWGTHYSDDPEDSDSDNTSDSEDEDDEDDGPSPYTPPRTFNTMLAFSPTNLPGMLHALTVDVQPVLRPLSRRAIPAHGLYLLSRFAAIWCDESWLEDVVVEAVDKIEEVVYARPEDLSHLAFWLFNTTLLVHLLRCDQDIAEICDELELFDLLEELVNAIFVFIIRTAEKRIDPLIDPALLDHSSLSPEYDTIQFESDNWSFFRSLGSRKKLTSTPPPKIIPPKFNGTPSIHTPPPSSTPTRPASPSPSVAKDSPGTKALSTLRSTFNRSIPSSMPASPRNIISPSSITSIFTALHTLLSLYSINPVLVIQAYSQILYWTSCELFNRLLTRKKYLCRSKAMQIGLNVGAIEEWVVQMGLPKGVSSHYLPVRELLSWLQCSSSIGDFPALIDTIQSMRHLNPLQMRRAVRDYRFEVNESRMTEECTQYLAQLQKDWERRRVKLGVEIARKERELDKYDSSNSEGGGNGDNSPAQTQRDREREKAQEGIDTLFDRERPKGDWLPLHPPEVLGELLDSRYMIPLVLPSDPTLICAVPGEEALHPPQPITAGDGLISHQPTTQGSRSLGQSLLKRDDGDSRSSSRASHRSHASINSIASLTRGPMRWRNRARGVRVVSTEVLDLVDGGRFVEPPDVVPGPLDRKSSTEGLTSIGVEHVISVEVEGEVQVNVVEDGFSASENNRAGYTSPLTLHTMDFNHHWPDNSLAEATFSLDHQPLESTPTRSHLTPTPIKPAMGDRRRSLRLARRSSGGETIRPYEDLILALSETPTKDRPDGSFA